MGWLKMTEKGWFNKETKEVEKELETDIEKGLSTEQVQQKRETYGLNQLKTAKKKSLIQRFL